MGKYILTIKSSTEETTKTFSNSSSAYIGFNKELDNLIEKIIKDFNLSGNEKEAYIEATKVRRNNVGGTVPNPKNLDENLYLIYLDKLPKKAKTRIINLYDCDTNFLVETNATEKEIEKAIAYKNDLLENDKSISSDFEAMQEYLENKGFTFKSIGYVNEIESYEW